MKRLCQILFPSILMVLLGLTASANAVARMKHSGVIDSIAHDTRGFVLAELGPLAGPERRDRETRLGPEGVYPNDYVTIDCRHEGRRLVAVKITVTELPDEQALLRDP